MTEVIDIYGCKICNKKYLGYQSLWIHNNKFHNKTINHDVSNVSSNIKCKFCLKLFEHRSSKSRHQKNCNQNNNMSNTNQYL